MMIRDFKCIRLCGYPGVYEVIAEKRGHNNKPLFLVEDRALGDLRRHIIDSNGRVLCEYVEDINDYEKRRV